ncbi:unnamed protein product [Linum tenue]|uniref:Uncharacterized protein n=1 Tax=Linum tenue TaxID=586396 RepID=A0AAV0RK32_9ROSI|nr:unnamed protein product [Linum tenue]
MELCILRLDLCIVECFIREGDGLISNPHTYRERCRASQSVQPDKQCDRHLVFGWFEPGRRCHSLLQARMVAHVARRSGW